jgi:hypothetical protein
MCPSCRGRHRDAPSDGPIAVSSRKLSNRALQRTALARRR